MVDPASNDDKGNATWAIAVRAPNADPAELRHALQATLTDYWRPISSFIQRKWSMPPAEAKALTRAYIADVKADDFPQGDQGKARFRASLRASVEKFMADSTRERKAETRKIALPDNDADDNERAGTRDSASPEETFRREWVRAAFRGAIERLRSAYSSDGKRTYMKVFEHLHLSAGSGVSYESVAQELDLQIWDVTNCLADARRRLRDILGECVREYALTDEESREETADLLKELPGPPGGRALDQPIIRLQRMLAGPSEPAAPAESPQKGRLGKYRMIRTLGPGTWVVSDGIRPTELVLHMLGETKDPSLVSALCADLKPLALLMHPVIVTYHKLSTSGGWFFTVRDFVIGDPLDTLSLDPVSSLRIFHDVARAMEFAHDRGLVHGAIKPSNVIVSRSGPVFLVDFAVRQVESRFRPGPTYQPPVGRDTEHLRALFISTMSGRPFEAAPEDELPPLRPVHPEVDPMLTKIAATTYPSAKELAYEVERALKKLPSEGD